MVFLAKNCRRLQPELMDQPGLDQQLHHHALEGLARINLFSGSARILWSPIRRLARQVGDRRLRILDIATGGGDVPLELWRRARRNGLQIQLEGCDISRTAVTYARERAEERGADIRFFELDAMATEIPPGYDIVVCSLFLHHLQEEQAVRLLRHMAEAANRLVLVNDLIRSSAGMMLAVVGTRLLSGSRIVHTDGPRSVQGAFTMEEASRMARRAGLDGVTVTRRWPCRFLLMWKRDETGFDR